MTIVDVIQGLCIIYIIGLFITFFIRMIGFDEHPWYFIPKCIFWPIVFSLYLRKAFLYSIYNQEKYLDE